MRPVQASARKPSLRKPLRIAVVTETYPPEINGVARTVGLMVDGLLARGHHIELVRPRQSGEQTGPPEDRLEVHLTVGLPIPKYPELQLGLTRVARLTRRWAERRPDVVHIITEGPLGWAALFAARKLGIPAVSDFHTNFHDYSHHYGFGLFAGLVAAYLRALHNRTQCTFVPTRQMRNRLASLGFNRLAIVGRGIDTQLFTPGKRSAELRRSWGCRDDAHVALYVGRLAPEKNLRLFVESIQAIRRRRPGIRVVIVGDGPMGERLRIDNPDFHFAGMRTGEDLAAHYASADLFLFPSLSETFGNVTMEALASGLAVVAFDYAAAGEYMVHDRNGLLAPRGDDAAFREHAVRLACTPHRVRRLRERARQTAEGLGWDNSIDALERSLLEMAGIDPPAEVPVAADVATAE